MKKIKLRRLQRELRPQIPVDLYSLPWYVRSLERQRKEQLMEEAKAFISYLTCVVQKIFRMHNGIDGEVKSPLQIAHLFGIRESVINQNLERISWKLERIVQNQRQR